MSYHPIFQSRLITVKENERRSWHAGRYDGGHPRVVILVRRGLYSVDGAGELVVADSQTAAIYDGQSSYVLAYPVEQGADCTQIGADPALMDEAFPTDRYSCVVTPQAGLAHLGLYCGIKRGWSDVLETEERALELLGALSDAVGRGSRPRRISRAAQRHLAQVRARMVAEPEVNHQLAELAGMAGCSPFHFARLFREATGSSVRGFRIRLRLSFAMTRLAEGADDLTDLALEAGFSSHSHMTASFQRVLNRTPSDLRDHLGSRALLRTATRMAA